MEHKGEYQIGLFCRSSTICGCFGNLSEKIKNKKIANPSNKKVINLI
jgi:hypothetical protein